MRKEKSNLLFQKKMMIFGAIPALFGAVAASFGAQLEKNGQIAYAKARTWLAAAAAGALMFVLVMGMYYVIGIYEKHRQDKAKKQSGARVLTVQARGDEDEKKFWKDKMFWITALLLFLCWLPVFFASFPGFFLYDAATELDMILTRNFSTHHPLFHVLLMGGIVKTLQVITGSYNAGIAFYLVCQAIFTALAFSYMLFCLRKWHISRWIRIFGGLYLACFPVIAMFAFCTVKDTLFTVCLMLFLISLVQFPGRNSDMRWFRASWPVILWGTLMMLFRHNGVYAFIIAAPFILIACKKLRKEWIAATAAILLLYFGCSSVLAAAVHADRSEHQESLTTVIQQLARIHAYKPESFGKEQLEVLYSYVPKENLQYYRPDNADRVKIGFQNDAYAADKGRFWKLWFQMGRRHPGAYINSFLGGNYGYWYPYARLNCYGGNEVYTFTYGESSYFGFETEPPGTRKSLLPGLEKWLRKISLEISWQKIPGLRVLFHPAYYFWIFFLALCYQTAKGRYRVCSGAMLILGLFVSVLFGPVVVSRYVLCFYFGFPMLLAFLLEADKIERIVNEELS